MRILLPFLLIFAPLAAQDALVQKGQLDGNDIGGQFGTSVAGAGDTNGDGIVDLIVGEPGDLSGGNGRVTLYDGATLSQIWSIGGGASAMRLGYSVAGAGDVNGDGAMDVIAGGPFANASGGLVYVLSGADGSTIHQISGSGGDFLGAGVTGVNDVDGDGNSDFAIGSSWAGGAGSVTLYSGATGAAIWTANGPSPGQQFGASLSGAGDVDGDGTPDVITGSPMDGTNGPGAGSATVLSGATGAVIWSWGGVQAFDKFGSGVSGARDFNKDGYADLLIGASAADTTGTGWNSGAIYVMSGRTGAALMRITGNASGDNLGTSVNSTGDVNADGINDFLAGGQNVGGNNGEAYVISGDDGSILYRFEGLAQGDLLGCSIAGMGDMDGDSRPELAVGARAADPNGVTESGQVLVLGSARTPTMEMRSMVGGTTATANVYACTPNGQVYIAWSFAGGGPITTPWGNGLVSKPFKYVIVNADASGNLTLPNAIPNSASGLRIWLHGADAGSQTLMNGLELVIG